MGIALFDPKGPIGADERSIIIYATCLMLLVVVPVIVLTLAFAWHYRASNTRAAYAPNWSHSGKIEVVVWAIPCVIVAVLATATWTWSHELDPYRAISIPGVKPIDVDVVSLDWKWLFIYPDLKIASVNEVAFPVGTPVHFRLTSASVMNSFFIPQLGSQVYTMAGMQTQLHLLASAPGNYAGISANYSGDGFSDMTFTARALPAAQFAAWVAKVRASKDDLTLAAYRRLAAPSERTPVAYYGDIGGNVYHDALNKCTDGGACTDDATHMAMAQQLAGGKLPLCTEAAPKGL
jgi:cytochrome o ubiquinol oxidase subunit II